MTTLASPVKSSAPRHTVVVRITHWITVVCFFALLVSGVEILISHPRFYWGEAGNVNTKPLFIIPIASSRDTVPTGYGVLPDQNGWSRYLHFEAAWLIVIAGLLYAGVSIWNGHIRRDLLPAPGERSLGAFAKVLGMYLGRTRGPASPADSYNVLQRAAYLAVIFGIVPLLVWTGLAMSPSFVSAFPLSVELLGGRQSARTMHFFLTDALVLFFVVHVAMVFHAGFWSRTRAMITGRANPQQELP